MSSKRREIDYLKDIIECINKIEEYIDNILYSDFLNDTKTQDAVIRNIEIIGEAAKNISSRIKEKYCDIDWGKMARSRDRLIHHYKGVNYDIVWSIIKDELPTLLKNIQVIVQTEENNH